MQRKYYLGLCAIAKNETPFLREWIAYHHYIGFEKIYIYDNESSRPVFLDVGEFYDQGICDTYRIAGEAMQNTTYLMCLRDHGAEFEWLAFFDLDEFLVLKQDTDVRTLLYDYEAYSCLSVQREPFSSSGHLKRPEGFVTLRYTEGMGIECNSKCIVRPAKTTGIFSAHHFIFQDGYAVNSAFQVCVGAYAPPVQDKVLLNHYCFRSQEDFAEKLTRGDATYGPFNPRNWDMFYRQATAETFVRTDILKTAKEVAIRLEQKNFAQRYPLFLYEVEAYDQEDLYRFLQKLCDSQKYAFAEVLFVLAARRFGSDYAIMRTGMQICMRLGKRDRAKRIVDRYLVESASGKGYLLLLEYTVQCGENADDLYRFILDLAKYTHDTSLKQDAEALVASLQKAEQL